MTDPALRDLSATDQARLARSLMRQQGGLGLRVASVFLVLVLGLPLANNYLPEWMNFTFGGFTMTWLFLGVVIYPITVVLSFYFVAASDRIEARCADWRSTLAEEARRKR